MDFTLSKEHEMARQLFKEFAEKEVKPLAQEVDEEERFPRETVEKMALPEKQWLAFRALLSVDDARALKALFIERGIKFEAV